MIDRDPAPTVAEVNRLLSRKCDEQSRPDLKPHLEQTRPRPALAFALQRSSALLDALVDEDAVMTGLPAPSVRRPEDRSLPYLAEAVHPSITAALGLDGWQLVPIGARRRAFLQAARESIRDTDYDDVVEDWVSLVAWISYPPDAAVPPAVFSSAAFPGFIGCVFVTNLCLQHVAPDIVFPQPTIAAVQDNLIHEALHHELEAMLLLRPAFRDETRAASDPCVPIPWRDTSWTFGRALHALYVYKNLIRVRQGALARLASSDGDRPSMTCALAAAESCARALWDGVDRMASTHLSSAGRLVLDRIGAI